MFIRIVRPQVASGRVEEAAQRWQKFASPRAKANPNFQRGFMAASKDRTSVVAVTLWDELPDAEMTRQFQEAIAAELKDFMTGPPSTEEYEVLTEI